MSDRWPLSAFGDEAASDLEAQVEALRGLDVGSVEFRSAWDVNVADLDRAQLERAASVLREGGITVSAVGSPVGKAPIMGSFDDELERLRASFRAGEALGTGLIRVFSFFVLGEYVSNRDEVLRRMAAMAAEAQAAGFTLVHENESHIYGDTPERCVDMLRSVGSPAFRAVFDPANFVQVEVARPFDTGWPLLRDYVTHVHIKDAVPVQRDGADPYPAPAPPDALGRSVRPAGQGSGQVPELLAALAGSSYSGYLTLEPHLATVHADQTGPERLAIAVSALRGLVEALPA